MTVSLLSTSSSLLYLRFQLGCSHLITKLVQQKAERSLCFDSLIWLVLQGNCIESLFPENLLSVSRAFAKFPSSLLWYSIQFTQWTEPEFNSGHSLWPHELQHARPPCPSPTHGVYSNSCPSHQWYHPTVSSSVLCFSSRPQSFPASGSF